MKFQQCQLSNGLTLIAETNPSVHSVAAGFFVRTGSRDETAGISGVSHFLEHMAFKGDEHLSADDINRIFDEIGAKYNASTSEEVTMYYAAVLPEYLERALELLSSLMQPSLRREDFDMEKNVILEEISSRGASINAMVILLNVSLCTSSHAMGMIDEHNPVCMRCESCMKF